MRKKKNNCIILLICLPKPMNAIQQNKTGKLKSWFKKLGIIGFLFFLLKGIAWLVLAYLIVE